MAIKVAPYSFMTARELARALKNVRPSRAQHQHHHELLELSEF